MKYILKNEFGIWQDVEKDTEGAIEVADNVMADFMNTPYYQGDGFTPEDYATGYALFEIEQARRYLAETDYVAAQWADEIALGIEHSRSEEEYMQILQKRQEARETIRNIV